MFQFIHKLFEVFNLLKNFEAGYSTHSKNEMLVKHGDKVYKLTIVELGEGEIEDYIKELS